MVVIGISRGWGKRGFFVYAKQDIKSQTKQNTPFHLLITSLNLSFLQSRVGKSAVATPPNYKKSRHNE